jgi:DNA-binding HxlR family transcriptional regulator
MPARVENTRSYAQLCGIATALDVIGDRWAILIVRDLLLGPRRFGDLVDGLPGIGTNTLTTRLKQLESADVLARRLLPLPERGTVYELTDYGRDLEPILMALGRWGARSMARLPAQLSSRSRWLVAGMLGFHDESQRIARATTWELRLSDEVFTAHAEGRALTITAGAPIKADLTMTIADHQLHRLLTRQLSPEDAVASGVLELDGDVSALPPLLDLFAFPAF